MNKDKALLLAEALESGEFKQTRGRLRRMERYCCLGVACELFRREIGSEWIDDEFQGATGMPPPAVEQWLGVDDGESLIPYTERNDGVGHRPYNFLEIAAYIREQHGLPPKP